MNAEKDSRETVVKEPPAKLGDTEYPRPRHPWTPGRLISVPDKVIKGSIGGIVRAIARSENGHAFVDLRNDSDAKVAIRQIVCMIPRSRGRFGLTSGNGVPLLREPLLLGTLEHRELDVTDGLKKAIKDGFGSANGTFRFQILLDLDPEPPSQPGPGAYIAKLDEGSFEGFGPDRGE